MTDTSHPAGLNLWRGHTENGPAWEIHRGDVRQTLSTFGQERFQCVVTSPPYYWQRDYKVEGQLGLEPQISDYVKNLVDVFKVLKMTLKRDGLLFLNLGDTYYSAKGMPRGGDKKNRARRFGLRAVDGPGLGVPRKTTLGMPWRVALAMIDDGWVLRSPIIWERKNSLPEASAKDRPWRTYETVFMFSRSPKYYFTREPLGNDEDVWRIEKRPTSSKGLHSAAYPEELVTRCLEIGSKEGSEVLDPFSGTGTTLAAALKLGRPAVGIDISDEYCVFAAKRLAKI